MRLRNRDLCWILYAFRQETYVKENSSFGINPTGLQLESWVKYFHKRPMKVTRVTTEGCRHHGIGTASCCFIWTWQPEAHKTRLKTNGSSWKGHAISHDLSCEVSCDKIFSTLRASNVLWGIASNMLDCLNGFDRRAPRNHCCKGEWVVMVTELTTPKGKFPG